MLQKIFIDNNSNDIYYSQQSQHSQYSSHGNDAAIIPRLNAAYSNKGNSGNSNTNDRRIEELHHHRRNSHSHPLPVHHFHCSYPSYSPTPHSAMKQISSPHLSMPHPMSIRQQSSSSFNDLQSPYNRSTMYYPQIPFNQPSLGPLQSTSNDNDDPMTENQYQEVDIKFLEGFLPENDNKNTPKLKSYKHSNGGDGRYHSH